MYYCMHLYPHSTRLFVGPGHQDVQQPQCELFYGTANLVQHTDVGAWQLQQGLQAGSSEGSCGCS